MKNGTKYYLAAYNLVAFIFWALYLLDFLIVGFQITEPGLLLLNIAQGLALLEILHTLFKWVKSPVTSTIAQVASRILVLLLIDKYTLYLTAKGSLQIFSVIGFSVGPAADHIFYAGFIVVSLTWSITELVRYSFYFLSLFNLQPKILLWMRYTFFIGLYPFGVTGEWLIFIAPLCTLRFIFDFYTAFVAFLAIAYIYYFPVLYKYMWKQRKARMPN